MIYTKGKVAYNFTLRDAGIQCSVSASQCENENSVQWKVFDSCDWSKPHRPCHRREPALWNWPLGKTFQNKDMGGFAYDHKK